MSTEAATPVVRILKTTRGGNRTNPTTEYSALLNTVRNLGLLRKSTGFYWAVFGVLLFPVPNQVQEVGHRRPPLLLQKVVDSES